MSEYDSNGPVPSEKYDFSEIERPQKPSENFPFTEKDEGDDLIYNNDFGADKIDENFNFNNESKPGVFSRIRERFGKKEKTPSEKFQFTTEETLSNVQSFEKREAERRNRNARASRGPTFIDDEQAAREWKEEVDRLSKRDTKPLMTKPEVTPPAPENKLDIPPVPTSESTLPFDENEYVKKNDPVKEKDRYVSGENYMPIDTEISDSRKILELTASTPENKGIELDFTKESSIIDVSAEPEMAMLMLRYPDRYRGMIEDDNKIKWEVIMDFADRSRNRDWIMLNGMNTRILKSVFIRKENTENEGVRYIQTQSDGNWYEAKITYDEENDRELIGQYKPVSLEVGANLISMLSPFQDEVDKSRNLDIQKQQTGKTPLAQAA